MKVKLINYTDDALDLLLYTKFTRLSSENEDAMDIIKSWSHEKKMEELDYMLGTIESSWEFVTYIFSISEVSRAFTHQLVRTRGEEKTEVSYAQQSQRTVSMEGFGTVVPKEIKNNEDRLRVWEIGMHNINDLYQKLREMGVAPQDARGVLPTNVETQIIVKLDLRTISHMMEERLCTRTQGEYQEVAKLMRAEIIRVHPWAEKFMQCYCCKKGVCRFPNYHNCPIKGIIFDPRTGLRWMDSDEYDCKNPILLDRMKENSEDSKRPATIEEIKWAWNKMNSEGGFEAIPISMKDGRGVEVSKRVWVTNGSTDLCVEDPESFLIKNPSWWKGVSV